MSEPPLDTHNLVMDFGRHKGEKFTRVPVNYLKWMVNAGHQWSALAAAELERRGTVTPELDVSGHAIDRASLKCWGIYQASHQENEGLHAWLARLAMLALHEGRQDKQGRYLYGGVRFAITFEGSWPVLKTVMPGWAAGSSSTCTTRCSRTSPPGCRKFSPMKMLPAMVPRIGEIRQQLSEL